MAGSETRRAIHCASVRLTPGERTTIAKAAARAGLAPSGFLRRAGLAAARGTPGKGSAAARPGLDLARWTAAVGEVADVLADVMARSEVDGPVTAEIVALRQSIRDLDAMVVWAIEHDG
ncbi:hypothetical protein FV232_24515 [Methylobacterium sp. WL30]|uniref:plasmid mobilization protein n=1 Tax=unclassified Methylobacterium TaxID=2615210 RepID=UPI0011CB8157|nr:MULTISPECIES: hypothetical protein [unclassified Methylobacterium]TXN49842.1 hypothetical protein FV227_14755 [Methylobacterium sp. WL119]TXN62856.1 hypothetical protein FV232_24515 [Methylobacterium sp. WL30]